MSTRSATSTLHLYSYSHAAGKCAPEQLTLGCPKRRERVFFSPQTGSPVGEGN